MAGKIRWAKGLEKLFVPIESVKQHPKNANNGDVDGIIEAIKINGYIDPITVHEETGHILAGNHRYQALMAMGSKVIPASFVSGNEEDIIRSMIANNRVADKRQTDDGLLLELMDILRETEAGLIGTGWTEDEYNNLLLSQEQEPLPEVPQQGFGLALNGIYEVTVSFDNGDDRDALAGEMRSRYGDDEVREANL